MAHHSGPREGTAVETDWFVPAAVISTSNTAKEIDGNQWDNEDSFLASHNQFSFLFFFSPPCYGFLAILVMWFICLYSNYVFFFRFMGFQLFSLCGLYVFIPIMFFSFVLWVHSCSRYVVFMFVLQLLFFLFRGFLFFLSYLLFRFMLCCCCFCFVCNDLTLKCSAVFVLV